MAVTNGQVPLGEDLSPTADLRKKYGILSTDGKKHGFPLPPAGHPQAARYARAVLSRAHQSKDYPADKVAAQVRKARRILGEKPTEAKRESAHSLGIFTLREVGSPAADGAVPVIIIREGPGNLGDRHWYPASTLIAAVNARLFEGAQCYTDHPTTVEDRVQPERSVTKLAGWFSDAKVVDYTDPERGACKAIEAQFHPQLGRADIAGMLRTCVEYAKKNPTGSYLGLSINAAGDGAPAQINGEEWNRVDRITEVVSVDLVTRAGAGGKPVSFQESYKMAKTRTSIDPVKLKEQGLAALTEAVGNAKTAIVAALKESAIQLTPEQDQALDAALGIVDGGILDRAIDSATGVTPEQDEDDPEEGLMGESGSMDESDEEREAREAREKKEREGDEEVTEADLAPLKGKSTDELMTLAAKHKKKADKFASDAVDAHAKGVAEGRKMEAAQRTSDESQRLTEANRQLKERVVKDALAAQNVPEPFRPRLERELMERASLTSEKQIAGFIRDEMAWAATRDGGGGTFRESAGDSSKLDLTFAAQPAYGD